MSQENLQTMVMQKFRGGGAVGNSGELREKLLIKNYRECYCLANKASNFLVENTSAKPLCALVVQYFCQWLHYDNR